MDRDARKTGKIFKYRADHQNNNRNAILREAKKMVLEAKRDLG